MSTATIHEALEVPQPTQHGQAGGILRRLNIVTGLVSGVVLALVVYWIGSLWLVPWGTTNSTTNVQVGIDALWAATFAGWVIGFMFGIGALVGPIRWALGRDLTHDDAEYLAGKDLGRKRFWKYTTDHKVVGTQYLVMALVLFGLGGLLAMLIRTELGATWTEIFSPDFYNSIIGTHGIVKIGRAHV